jgi:hypothetical protein
VFDLDLSMQLIFAKAVISHSSHNEVYNTDQVCPSLAKDLRFPAGNLVSSINKNDRRDITLKMLHVKHF